MDRVSWRDSRSLKTIFKNPLSFVRWNFLIACRDCTFQLTAKFWAANQFTQSEVEILRAPREPKDSSKERQSYSLNQNKNWTQTSCRHSVPPSAHSQRILLESFFSAGSAEHSFRRVSTEILNLRFSVWEELILFSFSVERIVLREKAFTFQPTCLVCLPAWDRAVICFNLSH